MGYNNYLSLIFMDGDKDVRVNIRQKFCHIHMGKSHGPALGVVVDGCPAGILLNEEDIQRDLDRRKPGRSAYSTPRSEDDKVEILSGVFEGKQLELPYP